MSYKSFDILWIEDEEEFMHDTVESLNNSSDGKYGIIPDCYLTAEDFYNSSTLTLSGLHFTVALVDFNLVGGINGNQIIAKIRSYKANDSLCIIFYSAYKSPSELKGILSEDLETIDNILFSSKETVEDELFRFLKNQL